MIQETLTDTQQKVLNLLPFLSASLSIGASSTIICLVCRSGFDTPYKRILFGLSFYDIVFSTVITLQPFLLPAATSTRLWASGNDATCTVLGALSQICVSVLLYNGVLAYYYLLSIRFGVTARTFARRFEPWMHAIAIGYPLITSIMGARMDMYSEVALWTCCYIVEYPRGCNEERGDCRNEMIFWFFGGAWIIFVMLSMIVINLAIFWHVRYQNRRVRRNSLSSERQAQRTKEVALQAFLYVAGFGGTFVWVVILKILEILSFNESDHKAIFPILVLHSLFIPLAGFFNLCIYLRPRYMKTRADYPTETRIWAVKRALYGESVPPTGNDCGLDDSERSSSALGAFRIGSLRKLRTVSSAVVVANSSLEHAQQSSCPAELLDRSSLSFCHCQEDRLKTEVKSTGTVEMLARDN
jgi:hypothetical protein